VKPKPTSFKKILLTGPAPLLVAAYSLAKLTILKPLDIFQHSSSDTVELEGGSFTGVFKVSQAEWIMGMMREVCGEYLQFIVVMLLVHILGKILVEVVRKGLEQAKEREVLSLNNGAKTREETKLLECFFGVQALRVKRMIGYMALLVIQYSLLYILCSFFVVLISSSPHLSVLLSKRPAKPTIEGTDLPQPPFNTVNQIQRDSYPFPSLLQENETSRILYETEIPDIIQIEGIYSELDQYITGLQPYAYEPRLLVLFRESITIFYDQYGIRYLNTSDLTNPTFINFTAYTGDYHLFPNGTQLLYPCFDRSLCVRDLNNTDTLKVITEIPNEQALYAETFTEITTIFTPDSLGGFFLTDRGLYRFSSSMMTFARIYAFSEAEQPTYLTLSADGTTLYVVVSASIQILNVSDSGSNATIQGTYMSNGTLSSLAVSSDKTTIFITHEIDQNGESIYGSYIQRTIYLEMLDISDPTSPDLLSSTMIVNTSSNIITGIDNSTSLVLSPDDTTLLVMIKLVNVFVVDVSDTQNPVLFQSNTLLLLQAVFSPDSQTLFLSGSNYLRIGQSRANIDLDGRWMPASPVGVQTYTNNVSHDIVLSSDQKTIYLASDDGLEVYSVSKQGSITYQDTLGLDLPANVIALSGDGLTAFVVSGAQILFIDIATKTLINAVNVQTETISVFPDDVIVTSETFMEKSLLFNFINASNLTSPSAFDPILAEYHPSFEPRRPFTITDDYLITDSTITLDFDRKDDNFSLISNTSTGLTVYAMAACPDQTTLLLVMLTDTYSMALVSYDISNVTEPTKLGETSLFSDSSMVFATPRIEISGDSTTAYVTMVGIQECIFVVDIIDRTAPTIINFITLDSICNYTMQYHDGLDALLYIDGWDTINLVDLKAQYALSLSAQNYLVGDRFIQKLDILEKNIIGKYRLPQDVLKFSKVALYNVTTFVLSPNTIGFSYSELPSWLDFNLDKGVITTFPSLKSDIGAYQVYVAVSKQLHDSDFHQITNDTAGLFGALMTYGYLDHNYYITSQFDPMQDLKILTGPFYDLSYSIRQVLIDHYFEMLTTVTVQSSLELQLLSKPLQITTLSSSSIRVVISLSSDPSPSSNDANPGCRFIKDSDFNIKPTFDPTNKTMTVEGPLSQVNQVLQVLTIDLNDTELCGGSLTIDDHLNPAQSSIPIWNLSEYLIQNPPLRQNPALLSTMQDEADNVPIYTGSYFNIEFDGSRFNGSNIRYTCRARGSTTEERIYWLTLNGLSLNGVPPEDYWPLKYELEIVVSNEYYEQVIPVTLSVVWGFGLVVKLLGKLLVPFTLWIYFNRLMNVLCKRRYRYYKDFAIKAGHEVSAKDILPIACIRAELKEAKIILSELKSHVRKQLDSWFISERQFVEFFFIDGVSREVNETKLKEEIKNVVLTLSESKRNKLANYNEAAESSRNLINQLVLNDIVRMQLNLKQERDTRQAFLQLKDNWFSFTEHCDGSHSWHLSINLQEMDRKFQEVNNNEEKTAQKAKTDTLELTPRVSLVSKAQSAVVSTGPAGSLSYSLLKDISEPYKEYRVGENQEARQKEKNVPRVNPWLLKSALVAHAYQEQHLDVRMIDVKIVSREKTSCPWYLPGILGRFFKRDLKKIRYTSGDELGYGLNRKTHHHVITLFGTMHSKFENKTLVIQVNQKRRIFRELWLIGVADKDMEQGSFLTNKRL